MNRSDRLARTMAFLVGSIFGSVVVIAVLSAAHLIVAGLGKPLSSGLNVGVFTFALWGALWHLLHRKSFRFNRAGIQTNRVLAKRGSAGMLYFGAILGVGILTEMTTPLVFLGPALAVASGFAAALPFALGFAVGRSSPVVWSVASRRRITPPMVAEVFDRGRDRFQSLGAVIGMASCILVILQLQSA
jgi:hypothetical protein